MSAASESWQILSAGTGLDLDGDTLREECGVFGIFDHPDAAAITALGLHALQHRGQEAAGIVSFDGEVFHLERKLGLVGDSFSDRNTIERLRGLSAIGHVRYSTTGGTILRNVQPLFAELDAGGFAVAHNGNLTNGLTLRRDLVRDGAIFQSTTDTEAILQLVARSRKARVVERFINAIGQLEGAYSLVGDHEQEADRRARPARHPPARARRTRRPSHPGLRNLRARHHRRPLRARRGERRGRRHLRGRDRVAPPFPRQPARPCIFEYIYFARPDSIVNGRNVYDIRKRLGAELAHEAPADADVVMAVPDSGIPAAIGFARACGLPYELGIIRNHYVGRTFIQPTQSMRDLGVRLKHSANRAVMDGKRIVLVDDCLVRGTTSVKIVRMMREAGAREVHLRIASPPITHPDFYGIDTPEKDKLLAATHDLEGMRAYIGADSLAFLSVEGIYRAMGCERRDPVRPQFTDHCFTGDYPTPLTDLAVATPKQARDPGRSGLIA